MKKMIFVLITSLISTATYAAQEDAGFVKECQNAAIPKLQAQAAQYGAVLDESTIVVTEVSNRVVAKYVWVSAIGHQDAYSDVQLEVLMQKPAFRKCF